MIHRRSIVYNIQWCGIIYVCTYTRVKIFRGLRPLDPRQGLCPCTPPGALRRAPGPHPKSARAYAIAMCAPRTCLPPQKNRLALTRSLCALRAHVCPKKIGPQQFKKIGSRFALAMCATRTCLPPIINCCPLLAPPLFKSWCRHWGGLPPIFFPRTISGHHLHYWVGVPSVHNTDLRGDKQKKKKKKKKKKLKFGGGGGIIPPPEGLSPGK